MVVPSSALGGQGECGVGSCRVVTALRGWSGGGCVDAAQAGAPVVVAGEQAGRRQWLRRALPATPDEFAVKFARRQDRGDPHRVETGVVGRRGLCPTHEAEGAHHEHGQADPTVPSVAAKGQLCFKFQRCLRGQPCSNFNGIGTCQNEGQSEWS